MDAYARTSIDKREDEVAMGKSDKKSMGKKKDKLIKIPSEYRKLAKGLVESWALSKKAEIVMANRMVATFARIQEIEKLMGKYPIVFEEFNELGELSGVKVNQLLQYLRSLESDFVMYYKTLAPKKIIDEKAEVQDFHDLIQKSKSKK